MTFFWSFRHGQVYDFLALNVVALGTLGVLVGAALHAGPTSPATRATHPVIQTSTHHGPVHCLPCAPWYQPKENP